MFTGIVSAQKVNDLPGMSAPSPVESTLVKQIASDSLSTAFVIWIKGGVRHHFHAEHTENIYVLEGSGVMELGESSFVIGPGDYILVPKGTVHSLVASTPVKVLSIQTPQWIADDRIFVEPFRRPHNE